MGLVILQGLFGKWTVTLLLQPAIVTLHLLGGMTLVALLAWLDSAASGISGRASLDPAPGSGPGRFWACSSWACRLRFGGWVSANYAALACVDFPTCHGGWAPTMDSAKDSIFSGSWA